MINESIQRFARNLLAELTLDKYVTGISINEAHIELSLTKERDSRRFITSLLARYNCDLNNPTKLTWIRRESNMVIVEYQPKVEMNLTLEELIKIKDILPERTDIGWMIANFDSIAK